LAAWASAELSFKWNMVENNSGWEVMVLISTAWLSQACGLNPNLQELSTFQTWDCLLVQFKSNVRNRC
jgi:hypothetical protein